MLKTIDIAQIEYDRGISLPKKPIHHSIRASSAHITLLSDQFQAPTLRGYGSISKNQWISTPTALDECKKLIWKQIQ